MADWLSYDKNGVINTIDNPKGLGLAERTNVTIFLEAENAAMQGGKFVGTDISCLKDGYSGTGYVSGFETDFNYVQVLAQVAKPTKANLTIRLDAEDDFYADIFVGNCVLNSEWNGMLIKKSDDWQEIRFENVELNAGDNPIKIQSYTDANLKVDWFKIEIL